MPLVLEKIVSFNTQTMVALLHPVPLKLEPGPRDTLSRNASALLPSEIMTVPRCRYDELIASVMFLRGVKPKLARKPPVLLLPTRTTPNSFSKLPDSE